MSKVKNDLPSKRNFWPKDLDQPTEYLPSRRIYPCPKCLRVRMDDGAQNSILEKRTPDTVVFRCKSCSAKWELPRNVYVFPKKKKVCKECGCETIARSTQGNVQYRQCVNDTCNERYAVVGKKL